MVRPNHEQTDRDHQTGKECLFPRDRLKQMGKAIQEKETMQEKENIQILTDNYLQR